MTTTSARTPARPPRPGRRREPSARRALAFLAVGVVAAGLLAFGLFSGPGRRGGPPGPGDPVPSFTLARLGGGAPLKVPPGRRPAVLLFFASWCGPCRHEIPALAHLYASQQARHSRLAEVVLLGVDGSDPQGAARAFVRQSGVTFPVGTDPTYAVTQGRFGFDGLPEAVAVRPDGTIAAVHYGALPATTLLRWQRQLLAS